MTFENAKWLVEFWKPKMNYRVDRAYVQHAVKAINMMTGGNRSVPSCSCEFLVTAKIAQNMFSQYEQEIMKLYNDGKTA